jgi:SAM-dependent methyltransferase
MPKRVEVPRVVHVIYEREAYGQGLVFDVEGRFKGALSARSVDRLRRADKRCNGSGHCLLDPRAKRAFEEPWEAQAIDNFSRYFSRVFREGSPMIDSDEAFSDHLWKAVGKPAGRERVLDLGSGSGRYACTLEGRIAALDLHFSPGSGGSSAVLDRVAGNARDLPFRNGSFSLVLCLFVLEHIASPFPVLREICRVLEPGGKAILAFPSTGALEVLRARFFRHRLTLPIHHLRSFGLLPHPLIESTRSIVAQLRQGGCRDIQVLATHAGRPVPGPGSMASLRRSRFPFNYNGTQTVVVGTKGAAC